MVYFYDYLGVNCNFRGVGHCDVKCNFGARPGDRAAEGASACDSERSSPGRGAWGGVCAIVARWPHSDGRQSVRMPSVGVGGAAVPASRCAVRGVRSADAVRADAVRGAETPVED